MNVAFTICSNNYLSQANLLAKSFLQHNPDFSFYIGLADKLSDEVDYESFLPAIVLPVEELQLPNLDDLVTKFRIVEFNTCVKPSYFKYLLANTKAENIFYLDPDTYFYSNIYGLLDALTKHDIIVTPHIVTPMPLDGLEPGENMFLNYGIYNLGFLGISRKGRDVNKFLDWWEARTHKHGFNNTREGFFTDQLWINLVPLFFENVGIVRDFEYNMAPWNLHERQVISVDKNFIPILSNGKPLVFFHFSGIKLSEQDLIKPDYDRFSLIEGSQLKELYEQYKKELLLADYKRLKEIVPALGRPEKKFKKKPNKEAKVTLQQLLFRSGKATLKQLLKRSK